MPDYPQEVDVVSAYPLILDQLSGVTGRVEMILNTTDTIDRRLHGSSPQTSPSAPDKEAASPDGYLAELSYRMERLITVVDRAESAINQLDQRVDI